MKTFSRFFTWMMLAAAFSAHAEDSSEVQGLAKPWQLGFAPPATSSMEKLVWLHNDVLMYIITLITAFVVALILYICVRFSARRNPVPSRNTHNTLLEVVWTVLPVMILVAIAIPSLRTHYFMQRNPDYQLTVKAVGHQWYWSYEYPDNGGFGFDSYIIKDEDLKPGQHRLLEVDNRLVVPVNTVVRVQLTGADVMHSWAVPAFGVKRDAIPGRLNELWFKAEKPGVYYGQCSQLCGVGHGFMPIAVEVVSADQFDGWLKGKQKEANLPVTGSAKTPAAPSAVPVPQKAVPPQSLEEPQPQDKGPQAPAAPQAAKPSPLDTSEPPQRTDEGVK